MDTHGPVLTPPPLSRWQWTWRYAVALLISLGTWSSVEHAEWSHTRLLFWVDLALGVVAFVAYRFHRRWPVGVAVLTTVLGGVSSSVAGAGALAFISMATRRRWREIIPVALLNLVMGAVFEYVTPGETQQWYFVLVFNTLATGIAVAIGLYIGARRELLATLS